MWWLIAVSQRSHPFSYFTDGLFWWNDVPFSYILETLIAAKLITQFFCFLPNNLCLLITRTISMEKLFWNYKCNILVDSIPIQLREKNRISEFWNIQLFSALKRKFSNHTQRKYTAWRIKKRFKPQLAKQLFF